METNRDYFSWSQYSLWRSSKLQFYKRYVLNEKGPVLPQFNKGKEFADYRETGEIPHYVDDPLLETVNLAIPKLGVPELKLEVKFGDINLLAYIDECQHDLKYFNEYKTGRVPWDQTQVMAHEQLDFYAFCIYVKSGETIIPECSLYWIETEEVETAIGTELRYTGHVERFDKKFTLTDIENIATKITLVWHEILEYSHEEIELDYEFVDKYVELLDEQKRIKNELDIMKLKVLDELNAVGAKYASSNRGRFSISQRKMPIYKPEILIKEKQYKDEIDKLKKVAKDSGDVEYEVSESIRFNVIK